MSDVVGLLQQRLAPLQPQSLDLYDESGAHVGHAGARQGGHFRLVIVSSQFVGASRLARHRLVYGLVGDLIPSPVHALAIEAFAPGEL